MTTTSLSIDAPAFAPADTCHWCAAPRVRDAGCRSCEVAEEIASELGIPLREMLDVARAHWE